MSAAPNSEGPPSTFRVEARRKEEGVAAERAAAPGSFHLSEDLRAVADGSAAADYVEHDHGDIQVGLEDLPHNRLRALDEFERAALGVFEPVVVERDLDDHKIRADFFELRDQERARDRRDRAHVGAMISEIDRGVVAGRRSRMKVEHRGEHVVVARRQLRALTGGDARSEGDEADRPARSEARSQSPSRSEPSWMIPASRARSLSVRSTVGASSGLCRGAPAPPPRLRHARRRRARRGRRRRRDLCHRDAHVEKLDLVLSAARLDDRNPKLEAVAPRPRPRSSPSRRRGGIAPSSVAVS